MTIQALIFDCDGTLTNSMPAHYDSWCATLRPYGLSFSEDRFYALGGTPTRTIVEILAKEQGIELDPDMVVLAKEDSFLRSIHLVEPIPSVAEVVRDSQGKLKMAVASGGVRRVVEAQLRQIGFEGWFETVVTAEDTRRHKPEPDVFLEAARRLDVSPDRCRVYEDSDLGIEAARRAGMEWVDIRLLLPEEPR